MVPVANGTEPLEAVITIDVLRRAGADVTVASVENHIRVDAAHQIKIVADSLISDCADTVFDLIALPVLVFFSLVFVFLCCMFGYVLYFYATTVSVSHEVRFLSF